MKLLITGGAGFIGSHLIDSLLSNGEEVVCVDNLRLGNKNHLKYAIKNKRFQFYNFDLMNFNKLHKLFKKEKFDMVYHLAANSDIQAGFNEVKIDLNNTFYSTFNILSCMKKNKVKKIMFASSSAIYGDLDKKLSEIVGPLLPISNYGAAKLSSEAYISTFCDNYDMKAWILRFPNVVGWRLTHGVINDFLYKLSSSPSELLVLGDGKQQKPYLYIDDLLNAIHLIVEKSNENINIFNIGVESSTTVEFIAETSIAELKLKNIKIKYKGGQKGWIGDVPKFRFDTTKIRKLGWLPTLTSNDAVLLSIQKEIEYRN